MVTYLWGKAGRMASAACTGCGNSKWQCQRHDKSQRSELREPNFGKSFLRDLISTQKQRNLRTQSEHSHFVPTVLIKNLFSNISIVNDKRRREKKLFRSSFYTRKQFFPLLGNEIDDWIVVGTLLFRVKNREKAKPEENFTRICK